MTRQILQRNDRRVLWEGEAETIHDAVRSAIATGADLTDAYLAGANLRGAYLAGANLAGANLRGAYLAGAYLADAYLTGANLRGADLTDANLRGADLRGADLTGAYLTDAYLTDADLTGANLADANLRGADLTGADHRTILADLWRVLDTAPVEVPALLAALQEGRVDGSTYEGACACLVGTLANARGCGYRALGVTPNPNCPAERWFLAIRPGHTPATSPVCALTAQWVQDWLTAHLPKETRA